MYFGMNPGTRRMWAASDAQLPGSGQKLEAWALGEIQRAAQSGALDMNDSSALRSFLGSLGITPEKGGGRFLFNKFMGPDSPLRGMKTAASMRSAFSGGAMSPVEMGRREVVSRFGSNPMLGPLSESSSPSPSWMNNDWSVWG